MPDNEVNVNHDELAAEGAAIPLPPGADLAPPPGPGGDAPAGELAAPPATSWASSTPSLVFLIDRLVMPNWQLTDQEKADLGDALTPVLDDLFPGGLGSEKWAPYFRLVGVGAAITIARLDDGKLRPMRAPAREGEGAAANVDRAPGPFTTAAPSGSH